MDYDRIIIELLSRVNCLEEEISKLNNRLDSFTIVKTNHSGIQIPNFSRDTTKYYIDGVKYSKNKLPLAIVRKYLDKHSNISEKEFLTEFPKQLQGSLGVVRLAQEVFQKYGEDAGKRFWINDSFVIEGKEYVCCSQWSIDNIKNIITKAEELGIIISIVK